VRIRRILVSTAIALLALTGCQPQGKVHTLAAGASWAAARPDAPVNQVAPIINNVICNNAYKGTNYDKRADLCNECCQCLPSVRG
jgi:hypothetical protein